MSYYHTTEDYDISGSKIKSDPPSSDTGRDENERGHTNIDGPVYSDPLEKTSPYVDVTPVFRPPQKER